MFSRSHMTDVPPTITYASVVSHETVRIDLMMVELNGMSIKNHDIMNAYTKSPWR